MSPEQQAQMDEDDDGHFDITDGFIPIEDTYRIGDSTVPKWMMDAILEQKVIPRGTGAMVLVRGHYLYAALFVVIAKAGPYFSLFETEVPQ
jgi:hypothetical protein